MKSEWEEYFESLVCLRGLCMYVKEDPLEAEKGDGFRKVLEEKERHRKEFKDYLRCRKNAL